MFKTIGVSLLAIAIASSAHAQQIGDVFYIALENHNFTQPSTVPAGTPQQLFGNPAAPFLNSLVTQGNPNAANVSFAGNYQNVSPNLHPSEPNYVYQVSGVTGPPQRQRSLSEQHRQRSEPQSAHGGEGPNLAFVPGGHRS